MRYALAGLGLTEQQIGGDVTSVVATGVSFIPGIGPILGAAVGIVGTLVTQLFAPNLQKIQASNDANEIEPILKQNLANWLSIPTNERYKTVQAAALNVFDQAWLQYEQLVTPLLPQAPDSISDRQEGSCAYHTAQQAGWSGTTYTSNEPNQPTGYCWNWFVGYRDPIANDPYVQPDPAGASAATSALSSTLGSSWPLFLGGALLLGGLLLFHD